MNPKLINMSHANILLEDLSAMHEVSEFTVGAVFDEIKAQCDALRAELEGEAERRLVRETYEAVVEWKPGAKEKFRAQALDLFNVRLELRRRQ